MNEKDAQAANIALEASMASFPGSGDTILNTSANIKARFWFREGFHAGLAHARGEAEQDASAEFVKHTDTLLALMKSRADLRVSEECMKRLNAAAIAAIEQTKGEGK